MTRRTIPPHIAAALVLIALLAACGGGEEPAPGAPGEAPAAPPPPGKVTFTAVEDQAGVDFTHVHGGSGEKYSVETMGSGTGVLDYDGDGLEDLYMVQGGALPGFQPSAPLRNALYRNLGGGKFRDVTVEAGAQGKRYGMGFCSGDLDNDGDPDIYLANWGQDVLLRNMGDGTFRDDSAAAGISNTPWAASCAMADVNTDGALDVYVVNYVVFDLDKNMKCGNRFMGTVSYCHPDVYAGISGILYLNNMDGTFTDRTRELGLFQGEGKGLGAVFGDYDGDGHLDLYVANDSVQNYLFMNDGTGHFSEEGLFAGVAYNENGATEAGMGVSSGDLDGDGDLEIYVSNLDMETNSLYRNLGDGLFADATFESGIGEPSLLFLAFGNNFFDADNDGDLDIYVANGHVLDDIQAYNKSITHAERAHLFINDGTGHFLEEGLEHGDFFRWEGVGRGSATFDMEGDGDLDLLLSFNNGKARLVRNDGGSRLHWLKVRLVGRESNRQGVGSRVVGTVGGKRLYREIQAGSSYSSQSSLIAHLGLGQATSVDELEVRWPSGRIQTFSNVPGDRLVVVDEEEGLRQ